MGIQMVIVIIAFLTLLATLIGLVPVWDRYLTDRPHLLRRVVRPLGWLRRWWPLLFANVVYLLTIYIMWIRPDLRWIAFIAAAVFLPSLFRRRVRAGIACLHLRLLWRVAVRPARDAFGLEATPTVSDLFPDFDQRLRRGGVRDLSNDSLALLADALSRRSRGSVWVVVYYPDGVPLDDPPEMSLPVAQARFVEAGKELVEGKWISGFVEPTERLSGRLEMKIILPTHQIYQIQRVALEVRSEQLRREMLQHQTDREERVVRVLRGVMGLKCDSLNLLQRVLTVAVQDAAGSVSVAWPNDVKLEPPASTMPEAHARLKQAVREVHSSKAFRARWQLKGLVPHQQVKVTARLLTLDLDELRRLKREVDLEVLLRRTEDAK